MQITGLNHVALHVADLHASGEFYEKVLKLEKMIRPEFDFPGTWYRLGTDQELHLIARDPAKGGRYSIPRERHFALAVGDADEVVKHLDECGIEYQGPRKRPDGLTQIYVRDPDGHVIEFCEVEM